MEAGFPVALVIPLAGYQAPESFPPLQRHLNSVT